MSKGAKIALFVFVGIGAALAVTIAAFVIVNSGKRSSFRETFLQKEALLRETVVTPENEAALKGAAGDAGYVVFLSVGDTEKRAYVFNGRGATLESAWKSAADAALEGEQEYLLDPVWVKAEAVSNVEPRTLVQIKKDLTDSLNCYYFYGIAFDGSFDLALTEGELNSSKIFDYDDNTISLKYLKRYLKETGRRAVNAVPEDLLRFQTKGWICDENSAVYELCDSGLSYGRRIVEKADGDYVKQMVKYDMEYLRSALHSDGKFDYAVLARFGNQIDWYNAARHAGTVWSMIQGYQLWPDEGLKADIDKAMGYLKKQILYNGDAAHVYWENRDDIELGGNAITLIALTEYIGTFGDDSDLELCAALARGILSMQNGATGGFIHVLNKDFSVQKEFESEFYEGEAVFALLRLYGLNGDETLLTAAKKHSDRFIAEDFNQYNEQWMSYTFNELTKYVDDPRYYAFGLENAMNSLSYIKARRTPAPTRLEQLSNAFEIWQRAVQKGIPTDGFDLQDVLNTVAVRVQRLLDGRFYPEIAMHMANPKQIVYSFMMRYEDFRVRIDDVQHNVGGSYLYVKNYDQMVAAGMPVSAAALDPGDPSGGAEEPEEGEGD